jgi:hypothetical protein
LKKRHHKKRASGVSQGIDLASNPSTTKKKKKEEGEGGGGGGEEEEELTMH